MRNNHLFVPTRELLLTAILFVSAAAIITGTILSAGTTTAALAAKSTKTTTTNDDGNKPTSTSTTNAPSLNEKQKQELITAPSIPFTTPSPSTTAITPDLSSSPSSTSSSTTVGTQSLSSVKALQTNNIVNTQSYYDIIFKTGTTATIGKIDITFPSGTVKGGRVTVEASGIGGGSTSTSGNTLTYTVSSPVSISSGKTIRLEFGGIGNPSNPSSSYTVTVTTKKSDGTIIEGPATSSAYSIKQIGTNDIANGAVTGSKIAGTSKLVFVQCTVFDSNSYPAGATVFYDCLDTSIASGDAVVATLNFHGAACAELRNVEALDGKVEFRLGVECSSVTFNPSGLIAIVFKRG